MLTGLGFLQAPSLPPLSMTPRLPSKDNVARYTTKSRSKRTNTLVNDKLNDKQRNAMCGKRTRDSEPINSGSALRRRRQDVRAT
jgi:hypothetical protein